MDLQTMLVITAYPSDALLNCGGTLMKYIQEGHSIHLLIVSDGLTHSAVFTAAELEKDRAKCIRMRREEFTSLYLKMGVASVECLGLDDSPLTIDHALWEQIAARIRTIRPDFIVTHAREKDLDCLDYTSVAQAVVKAYAIASAAGAPCGGLAVSPRQTPMFGMEPLRPENCGWDPGIMIDITDYEPEKETFLANLSSEQVAGKLIQQRARARGVHSSGRGGKTGCKYAEAFSCYGPVYAFQHFVW